MKKLFENIILSIEDCPRDEKAEELLLPNAVIIGSFGAFKDWTSLKSVYFGPDITRIGAGTFDGCTSLTDVWFPLFDENKIVEIEDNAFRNCPNQITFHIFASALKNKYLNAYARKHGFRVVGMI